MLKDKVYSNNHSTEDDVVKNHSEISVFSYTNRTSTYNEQRVRIRRVSASLILILLKWRICWASNNASRWQMGFNSAFKGL